MIHVFADHNHAGTLEKEAGKPYYVFTYRPEVDLEQSVSLTMPVRLKSYVSPAGSLHPIFDMNLPEGFLRNYLMKAVPDCDDLKLLEITGPSQVGRLAYRGPEQLSTQPIPEYNIQDILTFDGAEDLFQDLLGLYAAASGVSGVQPKVLVRDPGNTKMSPDHKLAVRATTHIAKTWDAKYPHLAYNEHFCLLAAKYAGLPTPFWEVSKNGKFLVVERFDLTEENRYLGFEDFCVLAGLPSSKKYHGSYEQLTKVLGNFCFQEHLREGLADLFKMIAISVVLRNGDAHRKNFCLLYNSPAFRRGKLAPTFDIVTTTAYLPNDAMALTMEGSKRWPTKKRLLRFATNHCGLQHRQAIKIFEEVKEGTRKAQKELEQGIKYLEGFYEIGQKISEQWKQGLLT
ncbi:MAG: type II toxin-antitoxin system HipA family toxin [Desulfovermiculus sp.]